MAAGFFRSGYDSTSLIIFWNVRWGICCLYISKKAPFRGKIDKKKVPFRENLRLIKVPFRDNISLKKVPFRDNFTFWEVPFRENKRLVQSVNRQ